MTDARRASGEGQSARPSHVARSGALLLAAGLSACAPVEPADRFAGPFEGAIVAEEPLAARAGRDMLLAGGTAADAAAAAAFTYGVTLPSMAGLAGGGVCVVKPPGQPAETLEFYAEAPPLATVRGERPAALPGVPRGMNALVERYGRGDLETALAAAIALSRDGAPVSRALAGHLAAAGGFIAADPAAAEIFFTPEGRPLSVGEPLVQPQLHGFLSALSRRGVGALYQGDLGRGFVEQSFDAGAPLEMDDLRTVRPRWRGVGALSVGGRTVIGPPPPAGAGAVAAQIYAGLTVAAPTDEALFAHAAAEALARAFAERRRYANPGESERGDWSAEQAYAADGQAARMAGFSREIHTPPDQFDNPPGEAQGENFALASLAAIDRDGLAVACSLSPNNPFGVGRMARGKGVFLAADPGATNGGPVSLGPVIVVDAATDRVEAIAAPSGGVMGPAAAATGLYRLLDRGEDARLALRAPRLHHSGAPDILYAEAGVDEAIVEALRVRGHEVQQFPGETGEGPGRAMLIHCPGGFDAKDEGSGCVAAIDPRGDGLAFGAR